jgi:hypothetical protein
MWRKRTPEMERATSLIDEIDNLERRLKNSREELEGLQDACDHMWGDTIHHPSTEEWKYLTHPDPEQERRLAMTGHPPTGIKVGEPEHWTRTCRKCGLSERTEKVKREPMTHTIPQW